MLFVIIVILGCANAPPPYVCVAGVATLEDRPVQQVLICRPVSPSMVVEQ